MSECQSVRGEWGGICPDCGQRLPERPRGAPSSKTQHAIGGFGTIAAGWSSVRKAAYERSRGPRLPRVVIPVRAPGELICARPNCYNPVAPRNFAPGRPPINCIQHANPSRHRRPPSQQAYA